MHELSLARDLLAAIERKLDRGNARVVRVSVGVGAAAGIVLVFPVSTSWTRSGRGRKSIRAFGTE